MSSGKPDSGLGRTNEMKKVAIIIAMLCFFSSRMMAQEETLVGGGDIEHGGFGAPVVKYTQIIGEPSLLVGGRGGWIINHTFVIGGGGYGLVNNIRSTEPGSFIFPYGDTFLNFGYGGLELEYIGQSDKLIHYSVLVLLGGGSVSYINKGFDGDIFGESDLDSPADIFFVLEPGVSIELNVTTFFRINGGISYRFISGAAFDTYSNSDLAGLSAVLTFKFGSF
jgi:hypothetical protein